MRQKHDVWYTPEINEAIGNDETGLRNRRKRLQTFIQKNIATPIHTGLDYGGDKGQFYPSLLDSAEKYVYEISGVSPVEGVTLLTQYEDCKQRRYDFIMCNHVLEHIGDLDEIVNLIRNLGDSETFFCFEVPFDSPFYAKFIDNFQFIGNSYFPLMTIMRHFFRLIRRKDFAPMTEHINYFTPKALEILLRKHGFQIIDEEVSVIDMGWQKAKTITMMAKLS